MSDDIEIPEVETDDTVETFDDNKATAATVAIAVAGVAAGIGIWYGALKGSSKVQSAIVRHWIKNHPEDFTNFDQKE